jgi:WD40 repeat protein
MAAGDFNRTSALVTASDAGATIWDLKNRKFRDLLPTDSEQHLSTGWGRAASSFESYENKSDALRPIPFSPEFKNCLQHSQLSSDESNEQDDAGFTLSALQKHIRQRSQMQIVIPHSSRTRLVVYSPDGTQIVTAQNNVIRIWDSATGHEVAHFSDHTDLINSIAFSSDGTRIVSASDDETARIRDLRTGHEVILSSNVGTVNSAAFSPDGTRVITGASGFGLKEQEKYQDSRVQIWDSTSGRKIESFFDDLADVASVAYSPDGTRILVAGGDRVIIWDAKTRKRIGDLVDSNGYFDGASFSPDGDRILTIGGAEATIWDISSEARIMNLSGHTGPITDAMFSADGERVATASADGTARVWSVAGIPKGNIFQIACAWLPDHDLSDIARDYGLADLAPICEGHPPLPDPPLSKGIE